MEIETTVADLSQRLQRLETKCAAHDAEIREKWRGQKAFNGDIKLAVSTLTTSVMAIRLRMMLWAGVGMAGGVGGAQVISVLQSAQ